MFIIDLWFILWLILVVVVTAVFVFVVMTSVCRQFFYGILAT